jgi:glutamyl/glutaminyl-tRNA synthetase
VFDEDKLAWVNRHYLKASPPERLVSLSLPYLHERQMIAGSASSAALAWLLGIVPALAGSLERLSQIPDRLHTVFAFDAAAALSREDLRRELADAGARQVVAALAEVLADAPRLVDRETFRAAAGRVKERTGLKGRALFHPIRVALTGEPEGPELDLIVPAIERAVSLTPDDGLAAVTGCRERAAALWSELAKT